MSIRPGRLYLWMALQNDMEATLLSRVEASLPPDEQAEARLLRRRSDREQYVVGRALVRMALSHHLPVPPSNWRFGRDHYGKPFIKSPELSPSMRFSVSHTEGLVVCLTTSLFEAGVDVETVKYNEDLPELARSVLSSSELEALNAVTNAQWTERFFDYWTLKEAYTKARGLGLNIGLKDIGFEFNSSNAISAHFASLINDDPGTWVFWRRHVRPQHTISVAARTGGAVSCDIILRHVTFSVGGIVPQGCTRTTLDNVVVARCCSEEVEQLSPRQA